MKNISIIFVIIILPYTVYSFGNQEENEEKNVPEIVHPELQNNQNKIITVTGLVRLVGSEPFAQFVIETDTGEIYYLPLDLRKNNPFIINNTITVQGELEVLELVTVDGKYRHVENHLHNITIIE